LLLNNPQERLFIHQVCASNKDEAIYSWASYCPFDAVKVVIIGQDPYHDKGQAMGLCFSVPPSVRIPPSLLNIYQELSSDIKGFVPPKHGCLVQWAQQGKQEIDSRNLAAQHFTDSARP
jgi:uracil-DNA glycosylase